MAAGNSSQRFVSGFVSILGRPNVGKSTLLNKLLGTKVSIVSDKPQTTRTAIQGVLNLGGAQVVFLDTPGIHRPNNLLNKRMSKEISGALDGRDLLLLVADSTKPAGREDERAVELVNRVRTPVYLVLNKVDLFRDKSRLLPLMDRYRKLGRFEEMIPVSALTGDGLDVLKKKIVERLPEGPRYFPEDEVTDQPERFLATELVREKVLRETRQEVPHSVLVLIDQWEQKGRLLRVALSIMVERPGQKAILIGSKGSMLKRIGTAAREEMERLFGKKIYLELFVKVRKGWRENPKYLSETGWKG